jgi:exonuclease SbcD
MSRILFTADLHIDAYGQRVDPASGLNARLVDYLNTLRAIVEPGYTDCDALVIAGDFTERRHPAPWLVSQIRDRLGFGPDQQVYLQGNHDGAIAGGSIVTILDDGHERIGVNRPRLVYIAPDVVLACIPFLDRHWLRAQPGMEHVPDDQVFQILSDQIVTITSGLYAEAKRDYPAAGIVLVLHQTLTGAHMSETQQAFLGDRGTVVDAGRLAAIGFDAVVAGHLHRHQVLEGLPVPVLYPGSIERVDFGEEREPKGFVIADVGPGRFDWRFVETPARRFVTINLGTPYDRADDPERAALAEALLPGHVSGAIVRVLDAGPEHDVADIRRQLEAAGAFEVAEIRRRPAAIPDSVGAFSEALSPSDALSEYFRGDPDAAALIEEGRRLLAEVAAA